MVQLIFQEKLGSVALKLIKSLNGNVQTVTKSGNKINHHRLCIFRRTQHLASFENNIFLGAYFDLPYTCLIDLWDKDVENPPLYQMLFHIKSNRYKYYTLRLYKNLTNLYLQLRRFHSSFSIPNYLHPAFSCYNLEVIRMKSIRNLTQAILFTIDSATCVILENMTCASERGRFRSPQLKIQRDLNPIVQ